MKKTKLYTVKQNGLYVKVNISMKEMSSVFDKIGRSKVLVFEHDGAFIDPDHSEIYFNGYK